MLTAREALERQLSEATDQIEQLEGTLLELTAQLEQAMGEIEQLKAEVARLESELKQALDENAALKAENSRLSNELEQVKAELKRAMDEIQALNSSLDEMTQKLEQAAAELSLVQGKMSQSLEAQASLQAEKDFLSEDRQVCSVCNGWSISTDMLTGLGVIKQRRESLEQLQSDLAIAQEENAKLKLDTESEPLSANKPSESEL